MGVAGEGLRERFLKAVEEQRKNVLRDAARRQAQAQECTEDLRIAHGMALSVMEAIGSIRPVPDYQQAMGEILRPVDSNVEAQVFCADGFEGRSPSTWITTLPLKGEPISSCTMAAILGFRACVREGKISIWVWVAPLPIPNMETYRGRYSHEFDIFRFPLGNGDGRQEAVTVVLDSFAERINTLIRT